MNKYLKRIQSYLSRKGVRVSQTDIRTVYLARVADVENPTDEEIAMVQNHFIIASRSLSTGYLLSDSEPLDSIAPAPLTSLEKSEMVIRAGESLDIAIATQEVSEIVTELNETATDDLDFISRIEPAILAYFREDDTQFAGNLAESVSRISQAAEDSREFKASATQAAVTQIKKEVSRSQAQWKRERNQLESNILNLFKR